MLREAEIPNFTAIISSGWDRFCFGLYLYELLPETKADQMEALWQVHLKTPLLLLQSLQSKLAANKNGRVVFIGSVYGHRGSSMETAIVLLKVHKKPLAYAKEVATLALL